MPRQYRGIIAFVNLFKIKTKMVVDQVISPFLWKSYWRLKRVEIVNNKFTYQYNEILCCYYFYGIRILTKTHIKRFENNKQKS
jgi:hypothetical protein